MRVMVVGAGYVGLVTGVSLAGHGHDVTFVERRTDRAAALAAGRMPIVEAGLDRAFAASADRIQIRDTVDAAGIDLVLIAVGTPVGDDGRSDLSQLRDATTALRSWPDAHISVRSTLPPGTSTELPAMLGRRDGRRVSTNPEFLRQGTAIDDIEHPTRIVIGRFPETEGVHLDLMDELYRGIDAPRLAVGVTAAELIKNIANAFLALKLSFVNEVATLAEEFDADVEEILAGIAYDPRIGNSYMRPGLGFGGSCLPKELQIVAEAGRQRGLPMHVARAASAVNADQQARFARRIIAELEPGRNRVALLGLSFKAGTDDLRGSPAVAVARRLIAAAATVVGHDPVVHAAAATAEAPGLIPAPDVAEAVRGADAIVIGTDWPAYRDLDWPRLRALVRGDRLFDGRNLLEPEAMVAAGFTYSGIGRTRASAPAPDLDRAGAAAPVLGAG